METKGKKELPTQEKEASKSPFDKWVETLEIDPSAPNWDGWFKLEPDESLSGNRAITLLRAFVRGLDDREEPTSTIRAMNLDRNVISCYLLNLASSGLIELDSDLEDESKGMYRVTDAGHLVVRAFKGFEFFTS